MAYTVTHDIVDTNTGEKLAPVQLDGWDYQTVLNGVGRGTAACRLRGQGLTRADWRDLMRPWKRTLVHSINGFAMYAGALTGSKWNPRTGVLNVTSAEVRAFAARRYPFMVPTFNPNAVTRFEGQTLAGIARSVLQLGFHSTPGDNWHIPLVLGPTRPGNRAMEWAWEDFPRIENMLTEVTNLNGGPDIYLDPLWSTAGRLEWWARYGTPDIGGGIIESRVGPGTNLDGLEVTNDATRQVSGVFALGSGSGLDRRIGRAGSEHLIAAGYPVTPQIPDMDMETSWDTVEDTATLDALALGDLRARRQETEVWSFNLAMDGTFAPHELKPGATVRAFHPGDEWLPEGWHDEYVMSVSGGPSSTLRVGVRTNEQQG